jgi:hypothetical protein
MNIMNNRKAPATVRGPRAAQRALLMHIHSVEANLRRGVEARNKRRKDQEQTS